MKEKYGEPSSEEAQEITTRAGATYENKVITWMRGNTIIETKKYSGRIDKGSVTFRDRAAIGEHKKRREEAAKEHAKDM